MLVSVAKTNISKLSQHLGVIYDGISSKDYLKHTHTHSSMPTSRISYHVLIEAQYRSYIPTTITIIWRGPHLQNSKTKLFHQLYLVKHQCEQQKIKWLTVTRPLSWNMYLRPSCTSWCARQTKSRLFMWLNCKKEEKTSVAGKSYCNFRSQITLPQMWPWSQKANQLLVDWLPMFQYLLDHSTWDHKMVLHVEFHNSVQSP